MTTEQERGSPAAYAILAAAGLAVAVLVWRSYRNDAPRIENYAVPAAPSAAGAPKADAAPSLNDLAEGHFSAGRYAEAARVYRKMLEADPRNASVLNELGLSLHYQGKSDEAVETLRKATALDPKLQRAWLSLGFTLKSAGRGAEARAALEKAVALDPSSPQGVEARNMLTR
jgi:Flp pilus assembly protein TadD